jgi:hypothetical protein
LTTTFLHAALPTHDRTHVINHMILNVSGKSMVNASLTHGLYDEPSPAKAWVCCQPECP